MPFDYARQNKIPYFGLCLGMQLQVVEFARNILKNEKVNSAEFDRSTPYPVIDLMLEQKEITNLGGTMRLGIVPLPPGTWINCSKSLCRRLRWKNAIVTALSSTTSFDLCSNPTVWFAQAFHPMASWLKLLN